MTSLLSRSQPFHNQPLRHHLELESIRELPDSHAWPPLDDVAAVAEPVPVIDLTDPDAAVRVFQACEEWGVFQLTGHGVPARLLDGLESQARRLFSLPIDHKLQAARSPGSISGYGLAPISSFFTKLMWSEGFTVAGSPLDHARTLWPHESPSHFCDVIQEYDDAMEGLAGRLMRLMLQSLGVEEDEMKWAGPVQDLNRVLQLNSYPACPDPDRAMGLAAHTDSSLVTILYQSSTSGLQVLRDSPSSSRRWVAVPPLPGALVVNVGDLLHILSNGRFKSVLHRAVVNRTQHRLSAACICGPPASVRVSPICRLVGSGEEPAYRSVTWAEYLALKAKLFDNALASLKLEGGPHRNNSTSVM